VKSWVLHAHEADADAAGGGHAVRRLAAATGVSPRRIGQFLQARGRRSLAALARRWCTSETPPSSPGRSLRAASGRGVSEALRWRVAAALLQAGAMRYGGEGGFAAKETEGCGVQVEVRLGRMDDDRGAGEPCMLALDGRVRALPRTMMYDARHSRRRGVAVGVLLAANDRADEDDRAGSSSGDEVLKFNWESEVGDRGDAETGSVEDVKPSMDDVAIASYEVPRGRPPRLLAMAVSTTGPDSSGRMAGLLADWVASRLEGGGSASRVDAAAVCKYEDDPLLAGVTLKTEVEGEHNAAAAATAKSDWAPVGGLGGPKITAKHEPDGMKAGTGSISAVAGDPDGSTAATSARRPRVTVDLCAATREAFEARGFDVFVSHFHVARALALLCHRLGISRSDSVAVGLVLRMLTACGSEQSLDRRMTLSRTCLLDLGLTSAQTSAIREFLESHVTPRSILFDGDISDDSRGVAPGFETSSAAEAFLGRLGGLRLVELARSLASGRLFPEGDFAKAENRPIWRETEACQGDIEPF
ncbi:hypothetical protein HK405_013524, partial [Cladochytrium tenue]